MSLKDYWYIVAESRELRGKPLARTILGERLVLFRTASGRAAALLDRCPHRNVALSAGTLLGDELECCYHGWRFDAAGACTAVPALGPGAAVPKSACVRSFPAREQDGYVWVFPGDGAPAAAPYSFAHYGEPGWTGFTLRNRFEGSAEACLENFLDCPHTVFVHKGWFRTQNPRPLSATVRRLRDSVEVVFKDEPISPSVVSRLLFPKGKELKHTDRFLMPSMSRVDYAFGPERHFIITSACTPVSEHETMVYTVINYRFGRLGALVRLFFEPLCRVIIAQDVTIIAKQTEQIKRFGGPKFTHLETDVMGPSIQLLRALAERRGEPVDAAPMEREVTIRF